MGRPAPTVWRAFPRVDWMASLPGCWILQINEGYIVSVHRTVLENRPVDPGSMQGSHRPISFLRIKHRTRANDILCKTE